MSIVSRISLATDDSGAAAPEYALLIALVAVVVAAAVQAIGNQLVPIFTNAAGWFGS
jgi:Flp pilus assembly pilin Flp